MSEGKRQVLEMLEQGKITQEDAARLLDALGETGEEPSAPQEGGNGESGGEQPENALAPVEAPPAPGGEKVKQPEGNLSRTVRDIVSGAVDMAKQAVKEARIMLDGVEISYPVTGSDDLVINVEPPTPPTPPTPPAPPEPPAPPAAEEPGEYNCRSEGTFLTGEIESLKITWVAGPVELRAWEGDSPRITEYSKRPLADHERLWFSYDDGAMEIRWTKERSISRNMFHPLSKRLVVELPRSMSNLEELTITSASGSVSLKDLDMNLENAKVTTASGALQLAGIHGEDMAFSTASGSITAQAVKGETLKFASASGSLRLDDIHGDDEVAATSASGSVAAQNIYGESLKLSSVSGSVRLTDIHGDDELTASATSGSLTACGVNAETLKFSTVSGGLTVTDFSGEEARLSTTSGSFHAEGWAETVSAGTVSGSMYLKLFDMPEEIKVNTTSGKVELVLPDSVEEGGFHVEYRTTTGSFESEFPLSGKLDKKSGDACFGDGETEIHITTMSGGIRILKA